MVNTLSYSSSRKKKGRKAISDSDAFSGFLLFVCIGPPLTEGERNQVEYATASALREHLHSNRVGIPFQTCQCYASRPCYASRRDRVERRGVHSDRRAHIVFLKARYSRAALATTCTTNPLRFSSDSIKNLAGNSVSTHVRGAR